MPRRSKLPTLGELERLAERAAGGDNAALRDLGAMNEKLGRLMNQRMRVLEHAGRTGDAYKRIQESLGGGTRFSQKRTGSAESLFRSARDALRASGYKESTLSGAMEVDKQTTTSIFKKLGIETGPRGATKAQTQRMNAFFQSEYWKANRKYYSSEGLAAIADVVAEGGEEYAEMMDNISAWMEGEDPFTPVETWLEFDEDLY